MYFYHQLGQISAAVEIIRSVAMGDTACEAACAIIDREVAAIVDLNVQEGLEELEQAAAPRPAVGHGPQAADDDAPMPQAEPENMVTPAEATETAKGKFTPPTPEAARVLEKARQRKLAAKAASSWEDFVGHLGNGATIERVFELAAELGVSQARLAEWSELSEYQVCTIKTGRRKQTKARRQFATAFGCDLPDDEPESGEEA